MVLATRFLGPQRLARLLPSAGVGSSYPPELRTFHMRASLLLRSRCIRSAVAIFAAARAAHAEPAPTPTSATKTLTLADAQSAALANQPTMREAHGLVEAAQGRVEEARAGYLPQVNITGDYERTTGNYSVRPGALPSTGTNNVAPATVGWNLQYRYYVLGATATQLIYDFGLTSNKWRAADANRDAAVDNAYATTVQTLLNVRRAYFTARADRDLVAVAEETVRNQDKHVEQTQAFVRTGIQPDINLATVLTSLANAKVQLVTARNNFALAEAQLSQAMGVRVDEQIALADDQIPTIEGEDGPAQPLIDRAIRARPEMASLVAQQRAQALTVSSLRGGYGPSLGAVVNFSDVGASIDNVTPNWYVGLALSWNIFQGGLTRGQVREGKGTLENLTGQLDAERLQVQVDVEQGRLGVQAAKATIGAVAEALENARNQLTLAEKRYAAGIGNAVELSDAQVAYTSAEAQAVQARFNLATARAQLLAALGDQ
jgi:outer membrane protein